MKKMLLAGIIACLMSFIFPESTWASYSPSPPNVNPVDDNDRRITGYAEMYDYSIVVKNAAGHVVASGSTNQYAEFALTMEKQKAGTALFVTAMDNEGNISTAAKVVVKDVTVPEPPKVNPVSPSDKSVTGSAEANAKMTVKVGGKIIATGRANSKGKFYVVIKPHKKFTVMYVQAADKAGNVSRAARVTVK